MATCRLSSIGNSIQPIREEPSFDERHADGEGESPLEHDRRRYLGYDPRKGRTSSGPLAPEIVEKAKAEGRQFFEGNPQDNYPDALDKYRKLMNEKQWEVGEDEEELFEYAMHPAQYEAYRSGKAKGRV